MSAPAASADKMKIAAAPGYRVPNFDVMAQGIPAFLAEGEEIEVSSRSPEWRAELKAGCVLPKCEVSAKFAPKPALAKKEQK